jgi:voltage-gated potassium channel
LFNSFFDAFYWAACTLTTVGYGDIYPISDIGRIISVISSIVGIAIIALPSGIVTAGYMEELVNRKKKDERESEVENE